MNSKQINDKVKNIGKLMSLESKINVVGSAKKCQKKLILFRL